MLHTMRLDQEYGFLAHNAPLNICINEFGSTLICKLYTHIGSNILSLIEKCCIANFIKFECIQLLLIIYKHISSLIYCSQGKNFLSWLGYTLVKLLIVYLKAFKRFSFISVLMRFAVGLLEYQQ